MKLDCHEKLPEKFIRSWRNWYENLIFINDIKISRWSGFLLYAKFYEVHGHADASSKAYAAVVYLRTVVKGKSVFHVLQAKTKVASIKTVTIARLELCVAALLAKLINKVSKALKLDKCAICLFSMCFIG